MKTNRKTNNINPTVGRNIRLLRLSRGLTISELAVSIESDVGNISRLERAKQGYSDETIRKIADFFKVNVSIFFLPDPQFTDASRDSDIQPTNLTPATLEGKVQGSEVLIEIFLLDIEFSTDSGCYELVEKKETVLVFTRDFLCQKGVSIVSARLVRVSGTSMEPRLLDGDIVGINTDDIKIRDGKAYAIRHGDLLQIKFLIEQSDGGILIRSMNRNEYEDKTLSREERHNTFTVLGRVFWSSSSW